MVLEEQTGAGGRTTRRRLLRSLAAGGAAGATALAGCSGLLGTETETNTESNRSTFVLSTAESGTYQGVGDDERRGFELAVQHLNEGGGLVTAEVFESLTGEGVLGKSITPVVLDSEGSASSAEANVTPYASDGTAAMFCGGVAGEVVDAHRELSEEHEVPYMAGTSLLTSLAQEDCAPHVYRELYSSRALMQALGPVLADEFGESLDFHQFYTEAREGRDLRDAVSQYFASSSSADWSARGTTAVLPGTTDLNDEIENAMANRPDVVVFSLFGLDLVNALSAATESLPEDVDLVVPLIPDDVGDIVGDVVDGVVGTIPWDAGLDSVYAGAFDNAYRDEFSESGGGAPTGAAIAHVTYTQTLQFAAAAERAGTFDPEAVRAELEDNQYDVGLGEQTLQACNHQATRPVPVVRGTSEEQADGVNFELIDVDSRAVATCGSAPTSNCSL